MAYYTVALPTVSVTPGPAWAAQLNQVLTLVEAHGHTGTDETRITPAAMNINADLSFNSSWRALNLKTSQYAAQASAAAGGTYSRGIYVVTNGGVSDLYYDNGSVAIQLTNGGAIVPTGTGAANGFYGDYASVVAKVYFDNASNEYRFYRNNLTTFAEIVGDSFFAKTASATQGFTLTGTAGTGGWQQTVQTSNAWKLSFDPATPGTFNRTALFVSPTGFNDQYNLSVNSALGDSQALAVWLQSSNAASTQNHSYFMWRNAAGAGSYGTSSSYRVAFRSEYGVSNSGTYGTMAVLEPFWSNGATPNGGLRIRTARGAGPTYNNTAFIELNDLVDGVGIGGAATASGLVTLYGNMVPNATNTRTLGTAALAYSTVYGRAVTSDSVLTLTSAGGSNIAMVGNTVLTGTLTTSSTVTAAGYVQSTTLRPTDVANNSGQGVYNRSAFVSNYVAFAADGTIAQQSNITSVVANGAGSYTINFPWTLSSNAVLIPHVKDAQTTVTITAGGSGASSVTVLTGDAANHIITLIVVGG